jgi:hypothetical protein
MSRSNLKEWWDVNIDTLNPNRLKLHNLRLRGEDYEKVQVFARVEDKVTDRRVKEIIRNILHPNLMKIIHSSDKPLESTEALRLLALKFKWQVSNVVKI